MAPMYDRVVTCGAKGCAALAEYKIAAPWSAGKFSELKTYGLACTDHYTASYREALRRRLVHPPSAEETQGEIALFHFEKGKPAAEMEQVESPV